MILTCPDCATRYFVGEGAVPAGGRVVRCAACAAEWRAFPEASEPLTLASSEPKAAGDEPRKPEAVSSQFRAKAKAQRQTRDAAAAGAVWAGLAVALAVLFGAAALFRVDVVRLWPRTAGAYAAVRLPVNPTGLVPEQVQGGPGLENGRAVLVVTGMLRNVTAAPRPPAPLRVALFDAARRRIAAQVVRVGARPIGPGESRPFQATFVDPPLTAAEFGVDFAFDAPRTALPSASHGAAAPPVRARIASAGAHAQAAAEPPPAPPVAGAVEAKPLPADSPYALHPGHG